jgi:hypothetical protein
VWPDGRVVDEDVDLAKLVQRPGDHRLDLIRSGHVRQHGQRLHAARSGLVCDGVGLALVATRIHDHVRAFVGKPEGRRPADVPPRTGHQGHLAIELPHDTLPSLSTSSGAASQDPTSPGAARTIMA